MTENTMPTRSRGQEVIQEAGQILRQIGFSADRGAYREGRHVAVSVEPRWHEDGETVAVLITCYAFGHRRVDWAGLAVFVRPGHGENIDWLAFLDSRGQTVLPRLPGGDYQLSLGIHARRIGRVLTPPEDVQNAWAAADEAVTHERRVWREGNDMVWTVEETEEGEVQVAVEARSGRWAGHTVRFSLVESGSKRVCYRQQLVLQPARTSGLWEGWCVVGRCNEFQGPYELVLEEVVPPPGGESAGGP